MRKGVERKEDVLLKKGEMKNVSGVTTAPPLRGTLSVHRKNAERMRTPHGGGLGGKVYLPFIEESRLKAGVEAQPKLTCQGKCAVGPLSNFQGGWSRREPGGLGLSCCIKGPWPGQLTFSMAKIVGISHQQ